MRHVKRDLLGGHGAGLSLPVPALGAVEGVDVTQVGSAEIGPQVLLGEQGLALAAAGLHGMPALMHEGVELVAAGADHDAPGAAQVEAEEVGLHQAALMGAHHLEAVVAEGGHHAVEVGLVEGQRRRGGGCGQQAQERGDRATAAHRIGKVVGIHRKVETARRPVAYPLQVAQEPLNRSRQLRSCWRAASLPSAGKLARKSLSAAGS